MNYQKEIISLRAIEPSDIDFLFAIENDVSLWKYSNRSTPYSKNLLFDYIINSGRDIFETKQLKLTIVNKNNVQVGFIDLFEFDPLNHRAGVGIVITAEERSQGYGAAALASIELYAKNELQLHQLYANIAVENKTSIKLFEKQKYILIGTKKDWNFYEGKFNDEFNYQKLI
jgi:diamine N-acetyltransferase